MIFASYDKNLAAHVIHFTISSEFTYFTLGVKPLPGACETCDFEGSRKITFNSKNWTQGSTSNTFNLGDDGSGVDFTVGISTAFDTTGSTFYNRFPQASTQSTLRFHRRGSALPVMTTEISPSAASAMSFQIYNLDKEFTRYKQVEVYGTCVNPEDSSTAVRLPLLNYTTTGRNPRNSYRITGNKGAAVRLPTSGYTGNAGKMNVTFEYPVEKVFIKQNAPAGSGSQNIGLGPVTFTCPQPLPAFTDEGLAMTKQASDTVKLCGSSTVDYQFRIYNSNCDRMTVSIRDTLPENMSWDLDLIAIEGSAMNHPNFAITIDGSDKRILRIDSLLIPGAAFPFTFSAKAVFAATATAGDYENQAWLTTTILAANLPTPAAPLPSADYYRGEGMKSKTVVIDGGVRYDPVTVALTTSKACYSASDVITITLTINNPTGNNMAISDMNLNIVYNEEFNYVANSITSSIAGLNNPQFDMNGTNPYPGYFYFTGFTLPRGTSTISFAVKAPDGKNPVGVVDDLNRPLDWFGNVLTVPFNPDDQAKVDFVLSYEFTTDMDDSCISTSLDRANGDMETPFCINKTHVITNKMIQPRIR
jgi:hypothetical protein